MRLPRIPESGPAARLARLTRLARPALLAVALAIAALAVLAVFAARPAPAQECTTLGSTVCRPAFPKTGICYLWECQQSGPLRQYAFTGRTCTCPLGGALDRSPGDSAPARAEVCIWTPGSSPAR